MVSARATARLGLFLLLPTGAAVAATVAAPLPPADNRCIGLFHAYDTAAAHMSTPTGRGDRMGIPPALQRQVQNIQTNDCLTLTDALKLTVVGPAVTNRGAAITPVGLHAGVVTNSADEAAAIAFFEAHGVRARSIGAAGLGRRIYLGPFTTEGALSEAATLARAAGFAAVYPADF